MTVKTGELRVDAKNKLKIDFIVRNVRKLVVAFVGSTVLFIGILMIVLPGPAVVFIPLGIGILAIEFIWARKLLKRIKEKNPFHGHGNDDAPGKGLDGPKSP